MSEREVGIKQEHTIAAVRADYHCAWHFFEAPAGLIEFHEIDHIEDVGGPQLSAIRAPIESYELTRDRATELSGSILQYRCGNARSDQTALGSGAFERELDGSG
jgi:hypothetical protein